MCKTENRYNRYKQLLFPLVMGILLCACTHEIKLDTSPGETEVTFSMLVPGSNLPAARALDGNNGAPETHIESIDVLVFEPAGGKFLYRARGYDIGDINTNSQKSFTVRLTTGTFDLVVMANCNAILNQLEGSGSYQNGTSRARMEEVLEVSLPDKWNANPGSTGYIHIPMFGERKSVVVNENTNLTGSNSIFLIRMVARVDVTLSDQAADNFELRSVHLYNRNTKATMMPATGKWDMSQNIVNRPSVPAGNDVKVTVPLVYTDNNGEITDKRNCIADIYTFEAGEGSRDDYLNNTCLVIGGIYKGKLNYYRADFTSVDNNVTTWMPLLRNFLYTVAVQRVEGPGFPDPDEAFRSLPENIQIDIVKWNTGNLGNVIFDNNYYLGLSSLQMDFSGLGGAGGLDIETNCTGWRFSLTTNSDPDISAPAPGWVSITSSHNAGTVYSTTRDKIGLAVDKIPDMVSREAFLHIFAGRFVLTVTIRQEPWYISRASISPNALEASGGGETYTISVDGYFDEIPIRLRTSQGELIREGTIGTAGTARTSGSGTLELPDYWHTEAASKQLVCEYYNKSEDNWIQLLAPEQQAYWVKISTTDDDVNDFTGWGSYLNITVRGNFPSLPVRFSNTAGTAAVDNSVHPNLPATRQDNAGKTYRVYVPYNDEGNPAYRTIHFQYWDGTTNQSGQQAWTPTFSIIQRQGNIVLPEYHWMEHRWGGVGTGVILGTSPARQRVLAHQDYDHWKGENGQFKNWYDAMGINRPSNMNQNDIGWNLDNTQARGLGTAADKYLVSQYTPEVATGCGAYRERDFGELKWMLPTMLEANQIKYMHANLQRPAGFSNVDDPNNARYSAIFTSSELSQFYYFDDFGPSDSSGHLYEYSNIQSQGEKVPFSTTFIIMVNNGVGEGMNDDEYYMFYYRKNGSSYYMNPQVKNYQFVNTRCVRQWNPATDVGGPGYSPAFSW